MRYSHIAFIAFPSAVNSNPTIPIVATLARRGHRVTYPTTDTISRRLTATRAEILLCPPVVPSTRDFICIHSKKIIEQLSVVFAASRPDVIVYDLASLAGPVLASRFDVPAVMTSVYFPFDEARLNDHFKRPGFGDDVLQLNGKADKFLKRHGLHSRNYLLRREDLNIYLFPSEFSPSRVGDESCLYAGRCAGEQTSFGTWIKNVKEGRPIVLVATSTTYIQASDYFRMCIDALADQGWHVILSMSDDADPASLDPLPAHFEVVQRTSHTAILPYANLLVFLGGIITSAEAAYHGVPLLITSCGNEELEDLGDNLESLGLGIHLRNHEMNTQTLRRCAQEVMGSSTVQSNVSLLKRSVRRQPGAEETANRIEEYIENHIR